MIQTQSILLVEDDPDINETVCSLLMMEGYEVICAMNGHEAMQHINNGLRPHLVFTDIMMPQMDGFELIERLSAVIPWKDLKILAATASTTIKQRLDSHCTCISKPYDLDKLLTTIGGMLCTDTQN